MIYVKIQWIHSMADAPILVYSEISPEREEIRKVELFFDGSYGFADKIKRSSCTWLGEAAFPPIEDIAQDKEFVPEIICRQEFEDIWIKAISEAQPCNNFEA